MTEAIDGIAQVFAGVWGLASLGLLALKNPNTRKWGYIIGVLGDFGWLGTTWIHGQTWPFVA